MGQLHRLLGVHVSLDLMLRAGQSAHDAASANDISFMSLEEKSGVGSPGWAAKLKNTLNVVRPYRESGATFSPAPSTPRDESFVDMGEMMDEKEKAVARKKAQKLEYVCPLSMSIVDHSC